MQKRIRINFPEVGPLNDYKELISEEKGKVNGVLGSEINNLIKLALKLKGHPDYQSLPEINSMLDTVSSSAHTHESNNSDISQKISNHEALNEIQDPPSKTKKNRAYFVMYYLMKCFQYEFTQGDFFKAQVNLLDYTDYRTTKSNLELLIMADQIRKVPMRVGKKNQHKQRYEFVNNHLFAEYNSNEKLEEFANYFMDSLSSDAYQIPYTTIKSKVKEFHDIENDNFTNIRIDYLIEKNMLKIAFTPENGNNIYEIIKKPFINDDKPKKVVKSNNI